ncbi:hypothetical protein GGU46_004292 [Hymenobacter latericoloratus]|uniref:Uncharacterized protein n=1 Tax=Hymenobacter latericoloratus TaxID=1411121 RepID=A0ABR6K516_9BACT|nr:hypothetical protein [Hymenobacter latericoloratus]
MLKNQGGMVVILGGSDLVEVQHLLHLLAARVVPAAQRNVVGGADFRMVFSLLLVSDKKLM